RDTKILMPGDIAIIPSNVPHSGKAIKKTNAIDVFYPVRQDYV
ncbi:MAG: cupin domain-containing protein, partial [Candidatus Methanofastidiosa archaeon]|nr:cupin domain-containing protein [Candidatus Methanofastidiosa archaeon]